MKRGNTNRLQIGCVKYLNAKPLVEALDADITFLSPSKLLPLLKSDRLDAALLPSIEVFREGLSYVPGVAVASPGKTDSVRLHHRVELPDVQTVALDKNSRTSNALTRILLEMRYHLFPTYSVHDPEKGLSRTTDAAVTIGDTSFRSFKVPYLDLGTEWKAFTGKPFVYALWAYRKDHPRAALLRKVLQNAKEAGKKHLREIARKEAPLLGLTEQFCTSYLTGCITFDLGPEERAGLRLFQLYAKQLELL